MKAYTPYKPGLPGRLIGILQGLALFFNAFILRDLITFNLQFKRYFVSREHSQSDTFDGTRLVVFIFKSFDISSSEGLKSYLSPGELYKLISVGDQIESLSENDALISRKVRPRLVDIGPIEK
jgi:hypothetical protein